MADFNKFEQKWQKIWAKENIGEAVRDEKKKKFSIIFAYPGISGYLHLGHMRSYSYTDVVARYKRMTGHNVLFPVGTHASGNQAIAFANKVKTKDKAWITYLKDNGCSEAKIKTLTKPEKIVDYFNEVYVEDFWKKFGFLADFNRFTCTIYPDYQKFMQWQFKKLYDKNLLVQKPYFATFCPKCGPVAVDPSETDISKGGNAEKLEYTLLKFKFGKEFIVAATLRPETVYGQTNLWINPNIKYAKIQVDNEVWIMSVEAFDKFQYQKDGLKLIDYIDAKEMLGKFVVAPEIHKEIIILPATFCNPKVGSGIVTCVPSDAPYDYIALKDLKKDDKLLKKYKINPEDVKKIELIPIIESKGYGQFPAKEIVEKLKIKSQEDTEKLEEATKEIYKAGFHTGVMGENCKEFKGKRVEEAKELMKEKMIQNHEATILYDLSEEVICRCNSKVVIKRIDNQWFIKYSDSALTKKSKDQAKKMQIYPKEYYENLPSILDWFQDRACARLGNWLGTKLPFDEEWTIEPISDSTLYPAYYIVSKYVNEKQLKVEDLDGEFFDYVFLGKGKPKNKVLEEIRKDFEYWYPLDFNFGGKEHKTVHFPVFLMNHVAILDKKFWPKGIFANWWLVGKGSKISKSKGGAEPVSDAIKLYSVDGMRLYYAHIGSPHADVVWDKEVVRNYRNTLERILAIVVELKTKKDKKSLIDNWLISKFNERIKTITEAMELFDLRIAATETYFSILEDLRWYVRRHGSNKDLIKDCLEKWAKLLCPITPHLAEEINFLIGNKNLVSVSDWPKYGEKKIDLRTSAIEDMLKSTLVDIREVMKLAKLNKLKKLTLFISEIWKYPFLETLKKELSQTRDIGRIMKVVMANEQFRNKGKLDKLIISLVKNPNRIPLIILDQDTEFEAMQDAQTFIKQEFGCEISLIKAEDSEEIKAKQASPGKPAIFVE